MGITILQSEIEMNVVLSVTVLAGALLLLSCSHADIEGNVFIVKGDGDINPAAGRSVYLLPYASRTELLHTEGTAAFTAATKDLGGAELEATCRDAVQYVPDAKASLQAMLEEIKQRETVPATGCSDMMVRSDQAEEGIREISEAHSDVVDSLKMELENELATLSDQIRRQANRLKEDAKSQLEVVLYAAERDYADRRLNHYNVRIRNHSEYCVRFEWLGRWESVPVKVDLYTKGIKVGETFLNGAGFSIVQESLKDEYGFDTGCHILPRSSRMFYVEGVDYDDPEVKLLTEQHGLPYVYAYMAGYHVPPDRVDLNNNSIGLYSLTSKQEGSTVIYTNTPVNWERQAGVDLGSQNDRISTLRNRLNELQKEYDAHPLVIAYNKAESAALACVRDQYEMEQISDRLLALEEAAEDLRTYLHGLSEPGDAIAALKILNFHTDDRYFEIPVYEQSYLTETVAHVMATIFRTGKKAVLTIEGAYKFEETEKGVYLLYSDYQDSFVEGFWLEPILIEESGRFDLTNSNFVEMPFGKYLRLQYEIACIPCSMEEFEESIRTY